MTHLYQTTASFPSEEVYGLTSQLRRSAVSIPSNIAEGAARNTAKSFGQFLAIALGSIAELETQVIISRNLDYVNEKTFNEVIQEITIIRKMTIRT